MFHRTAYIADIGRARRQTRKLDAHLIESFADKQLPILKALQIA